MNSTMWETENNINETTRRNDEPVATDDAHNKIVGLKHLAFNLLREVQSLTEVHSLNIGEGLDFYDEVSHFEIDLITRALLHTGGHQGRAARLLNLKVTTLNSKIKHYKIKVEGFALGYPFADRAQREIQHA
jgi:transcriptional regulator with GAF, ATPase, and Fis domain